jgi:hypothetical protein
VKSTYDFYKSGSGWYTLSPTPFITLVDSKGEVQLAQYQYAPIPKMWIDPTRRYDFTVDQLPLRVQADNYDGCNAAQNNAIDAAKVLAGQMATRAVQYLNTLTWSPLFTQWFGNQGVGNRGVIRWYITAIWDRGFAIGNVSGSCVAPSAPN